MRAKPSTIVKYFGFWPPYLASGISVKEFDLDKGFVVSQLKPSAWNSNAFGTLYGGSLYSMCDPFYLFILAHKIGTDYYVWDVEANIKFVKAIKGKVTARFEISDEQVNQIIEEAKSGEKVLPVFSTHILDSEGNTIAEVKKTLYVKLKNKN